ncbi:amidohydrolase [Rhodosalinus sediminis]|uniref:Amidohydrolase n=1 Tax=Rhodosalinus sediminis TaxID=1940533 RepID=A0A3D9BY39_9RHOB|nr:amidohydrolase [Rhodosalinus sediminis]REC58453.1 amidohydrolase [Rhodosalinus sediminis]
MPVINRIAALSDEMAGWRRHLHAHPEIGFDCHATARFVAERLRAFGVDEVHEGVARTGVVAVIRGRADGPAVGLRADMDALPMPDESGAAWASTVPGRAHACGHDGHTAMLLGAAQYLAETRNFAGRAVLLFQPAEEDGGGGGVMVDEGVPDRFELREVYALHNRPGLPEGHVATRAGPIMAAVDDVRLTLTGRGGHAARPHEARDPIGPALAIAQAIRSLPAEADPRAELRVALTQIEAGTTTNVIPEVARLAGTVRSFDAGWRDWAEARVRAIVEGVAAAHGVTAALDYDRWYPATVNHPRETAFAAEVARDVVGEAVDLETEPSMGAEDFAYLLEARPGAYLLVGQGETPMCHHPAFDFNDRIAPVGASLYARLVERALPAE